MKYRQILLLVSIFLLFACASDYEWEKHTSIKLHPIHVIQDYSLPTGNSPSLCVAPFESSEWPSAWRKKLAAIYENAITKRKIFPVVKKISWNGENVKNLIFKSRGNNCSLLLYGKIHKALASGGYEVQGLNLEIWIIETDTLETVYHVEQAGYSTPSANRDWFWKVSTSTRAAKIDSIARFLADQFAKKLKSSITASIQTGKTKHQAK